MIQNFAKTCLENGGEILPLLVDSSLTRGTGLTNPSIFSDGDKVYFNLRHVEYTLYHSEVKKYCHPWGPIQYLHDESDMHLRTNNFFGELNDDLSIKYCNKVDTTKLDVEPLWEFVGLEDARIVKWDDKLYLCGVRRDTTTNGQGRMELSEIVRDGETFKEVSRFRIPAPFNDDSYCEKNWMPVIDMPYHFVKWSNPTEVVKVDIIKKTCERVFIGDHEEFDYDFRGGSQVIPWKNGYRICLVHQVDLYKSRSEKRDARYRHRFIVWDQDWNVVKYSDAFDFISGEVEFAVGATFKGNELLVTFGFQDNSSFLLTIPENVLDELLDIPTNNKLKGFPKVYSMSLEESYERRVKLYEQFKKYGIDHLNVRISKRFSETNDDSRVEGDYIGYVCGGSIGCFLSHLRSIKEWYETTTDEYALFCEDDLDIGTIDYWNFTWEEFINELPSDWECVQLQVTSDTYRFLDVKFSERKWNYWGLGAYIIKRSYAKKVLESFIKEDKFILNVQSDEELIDESGINLIPNYHKYPYCEHLMYLGLGKVYTFPLFVEDTSVYSTYTYQGELHIKGGHIESRDEVVNWWKTIGKNKTIKELLFLKRHKLIDFFTYFDPTCKEILELRINMLKDYVDSFVICESNKTQSGIPITFELRNTIEKLNLPKEKIKVIQLEIPNDEDILLEDIDLLNCYENNSTNKNSILARSRERLQKDSILTFLNDFDDDCLFIISDIDEIIDPNNLNYICDAVKENPNKIIKIPLVHLEGRADLRVYNKYTNEPKQWDGALFICTKDQLQNASPIQIRSAVYNPYEIVYLYEGNKRIEDLGWHFSWMGGNSLRKIKRESFCHYDDTFSFLGEKSYNDEEITKVVDTLELKEGNVSPSGDINTVLKKYPVENLPNKIFDLPKVRQFLLPNHSTFFDEEYKKACETWSDINENLPILYELSKECNHVTEMGIRTGVSTRAFLNTNVILRSYDLHLCDEVQNLFKKAKELGKDVECIEANVIDVDIDPTDMLFIDTWHCYDQLKKELSIHANKVKKYIAFHDTHTYGTRGESFSSFGSTILTDIKEDNIGLLPALIEFMIDNSEWKFKIHKTNNNGLTVIERI